MLEEYQAAGAECHVHSCGDSRQVVAPGKHSRLGTAAIRTNDRDHSTGCCRRCSIVHTYRPSYTIAVGAGMQF